MLLNGLIQPFLQPERVIGFFNSYRQRQRVTRDLLSRIADQFRNWVPSRSRPILRGCNSVWTAALFTPHPRRLRYRTASTRLQSPPLKRARFRRTAAEVLVNK